MAVDVKLPDIGEGVTEGELIKWLVKEGDSVSADQPVAEVMTDKATVEVPTPYAGKVKQFKYSEGDMIPIETVMLVLEEGAGQADSSKKKDAAPAAKETPEKAAKQEIKNEPKQEQYEARKVSPPVAEVNVLATPATRRLQLPKVQRVGILQKFLRKRQFHDLRLKVWVVILKSVCLCVGFERKLPRTCRWQNTLFRTLH
jgi:pyruvate/2-oxoglutarate dehydrogenase complex dihydrolipoamide acyltransferase (E2) component